MAKTVIAAEFTLNSSGAEGSVKSLKSQLREAQAEVAAMSDKFGLTSEQAQKAAQKAAQLKDAIGDAKTLTDAFNPDAKFKSFSNAIQGVVGGFSALQGAQALFGDQSEELTKTLAKVQGAMALSQGINSVLEAKDAFKILAGVIKTNVVSSLTTLRGALIATGIGALAVGVGLLVANFDAVKDAVLKFIPGLKTVADFVGKLINKITDFVGVTSDATRAQEKFIKETEKQIKKTDEFLDSQGYKYDEFTQRKIKANNEYRKHEIEISKDTTKTEAEKQSLLKSYRDKANFEIIKADEDRAEKQKEINEKIQKDKDDANEKAKQKKKKTYEEAAEKQKKLDEEIKRKLKEKEDNRFAQEIHTEQLIQDARLSLIKDAYTKRQQEIENARQKEIDIELDSLSKGLITQEQYNINRQAIEDKYNVQRNEARIANDEKIKADAKKASDEEIAIEKAKFEQKKAIQEATFGVLDAGVGFLKEIAGKNKAAQKAAIITENAIGIAKQVIANQTANIGALATPAAIASGGLSAAPIILRNNIKTALGIATTIAATAKALSAVGGGGSAGGGGNLPGAGGGGVGAPIGTQMGATALQQAQINAAGNAAVQAFVLESDVSGNQERIERLNRAARIQ